MAKIHNGLIKNKLLDIESLYQKMKAEEDHFRHDTEQLLYTPIYEFMDLQPMVASFEYRVTGGKAGQAVVLKPESFEPFFKSLKLKNGFSMVILELQTLNDQMEQLKAKCEGLVATIDAEIKAG